MDNQIKDPRFKIECTNTHENRRRLHADIMGLQTMSATHPKPLLLPLPDAKQKYTNYILKNHTC